MSARRKAGEPAEPQRPAGAPHHEPGPAGAPKSESRPEDVPPAEVEEAREEAATHPAAPGREAEEGTTHPAAPGREAEEAAGPDTEREAVEHDLDALLEETKRERDEYLELAKRARADFENYRKRAARDASEAEHRGKASMARQLVPALDNLERALRAAGVDPDGEASGGEGAPGDGDALGYGVLLVLRELRATLEGAGVEVYDPAGERFDPAFHEALATRPEEGVEPGIVLETVEKGYRLDGQVLRAARVIVSVAAEREPE